MNLSTPPPQSVSIGLDLNTTPNVPTLTFNPPEHRGNVLASRNGIALQFFGSHPFAIVVLGKSKGPVNEVKTPFTKMEVLNSVRDPDVLDYPWYIDPKDTIVRIPPGHWGDYEFCYVVIMTTGVKAYPIVISDDPKIIIGRENSLQSNEGGSSMLTPEEILQVLTAGSSSGTP